MTIANRVIRNGLPALVAFGTEFADGHDSRPPARSHATGAFESASAAHDRDVERFVAIRAGSVDALEELIAEYWGPLTRWAARELDDAEAARDVVQETFIQVWSRRARWTPRGSPKAYLFRITRSLILDECRRRKSRARRLDAFRRSASGVHSDTPANVFAAQVLREAYDQAVAELPERRRHVFLLVYAHGLTHAEAAEALGISIQTVANQMVSALRQLRTALEPYVE
jgi:RNA polymerase sigma-70 factor, ECF subfamily